MEKHLITIYARSPIHVGSGTSVDVVDMPIMRERITAYPIIPSTSLKGVLLQHSRDKWGITNDIPEGAKVLFGCTEEVSDSDGKKQVNYAGCVQIMEAKILAFPVRSLAGCFAWITCPLALQRLNRDAGKKIVIPEVEKDCAIAGSGITNNNQVVLEEFALSFQGNSTDALQKIANELKDLTDDPVWKDALAARLAVVSDENFQHFVTTCTEINARIKINPKTRVTEDKALFNQENLPSESVFYSVLTVLPARKKSVDKTPEELLSDLLSDKQPEILQIGGDETTGHGLCEVKRIKLQ